MRVTNKMLANNFLNDMKTNMNNLKTLQEQMTSGKEIRRPSDDPFKVTRAMQLHTDINTNKQYKENITDTVNWLDTTDTALDQAGNVLHRVRELLINAGNAAYSEDERRAIKDEINEKMGELTQILNTNFDGKYLFGGSRGTTKPVNVEKDNDTNNNKIVYFGRTGNALDPLTDESELNMVKQKLSIEISQGVTLEYNVTAADILEFKSEDGTEFDLAKVLKDITNHLDGKIEKESGELEKNENAAVKALTDGDLKSITDAITNLLRVRSEVGAKQNRMEGALNKNIDENFNMTEILSNTEDIDITEKTMQYATMQTVYMASLQTSARVLQPTLMDYLR